MRLNTQSLGFEVRRWRRASGLGLMAFIGALVLIGGRCQEKLPERQWERGDFHPIGGKPYRLPSGLEVQSIVGADSEITTSLLPLVWTVRNITDKRISGQMPAGLCFDPSDHEYQYMMLLQEFGFTVPASGETAIFLPTYCCNEALDEPDEEASYSLSIQVWERELNELFDLVRGKRLDNLAAVDLAQEALFEITDGEGLTDTMRLRLQNLP
ncbi:MAG: hypothetical protein ABIK44_00085 [candidate division WOR-3 bacterium]